jgi:hypothetical protein
MPVHINEVTSTVHAFDATALVDEKVLRLIVARVAEELTRMQAAEAGRAKDAALTAGRRKD